MDSINVFVILKAQVSAHNQTMMKKRDTTEIRTGYGKDLVGHYAPNLANPPNVHPNMQATRMQHSLLYTLGCKDKRSEIRLEYNLRSREGRLTQNEKDTVAFLRQNHTCKV